MRAEARLTGPDSERAGATDVTAFTQALAERSCSLRGEDIPEDVRELAAQCLLDWFGVTLAGSAEDGPRIVLETVRGGAGAATVVGHQLQLAPLEAALVNGTSSHVLDFDDVNLAFLGHLSVSVLPAALALAEQQDARASELLTAFVAGYEAGARIAIALGPQPYLRGYHATATIGTFAATAACARLLGLEARSTAVAIGIAASQAAGLKCSFGTMTKSLHAGKACQNGLLAALLAARGFTGHEAAIETAQGFAAVAGGAGDWHAALGEEPPRWHLRENLFKYHAACFFSHSTIEGLRDLMGQRPLPVADIEQVVIHASELELGTCAKPAPSSGLEVKFSLAHLAAMTLLGRETGTIGDQDAHDAEVIVLRSRVLLLDDGAAGQPTRVEVTLRGGETLSACHDVTAPARDLEHQRLRLARKFDELAEPSLGSSGAARLREALCPVEVERPVRELMALARPPATRGA